MSLRLAGLAALLLPITLPSTARADVDVDLGRGAVRVHVPTSYDPAVPAPLIVLLHGYSGSGDGMKAYFQLDQLSEQLGFVYTAPDGTVDSNGLRYWNATDACCDFDSSGVDDSGYLRALVDEIRNQLNIAPRRIHFAGHSNGGFMSYRMACEHSELIASIASLAGASWNDDTDCGDRDPVHVLQIHGTADNVILYDGGNIGGAVYPSAIGSVRRWVDSNGCTRRRDTSQPDLDLDTSIPGAETTVIRWLTQCEPGGSGELWTIQGGSHGPSLGAGFRDALVSWFYEHPKPGQWEDLGNALAGTHGAPSLVGEGTIQGGQPLSLRIDNARENAPGFLVLGFDTISVPFAGGVLVPALDLVVPSLFTDSSGSLVLAGTWPPGLPPSFETSYQYWLQDPAGPRGFAATNALRSITP